MKIVKASVACSCRQSVNSQRTWSFICKCKNPSDISCEVYPLSWTHNPRLRQKIRYIRWQLYTDAHPEVHLLPEGAESPYVIRIPRMYYIGKIKFTRRMTSHSLYKLFPDGVQCFPFSGKDGDRQTLRDYIPLSGTWEYSASNKIM